MIAFTKAILKVFSFRTTFLFTIIIFCNTVFAQDLQQNLDDLSGKFIAALKNKERAKVLVVTDKSIYKPGENIWFRGFLLNSGTQKITSKNKFLFVDLVDEKDSVLTVKLLDAANQQLNGQLTLPAHILSGYYWIRAYTKQMTEVDPNNCFVKAIYVINKSVNHPERSKNDLFTSQNNNSIPTFIFYPEGGAIITGAVSTIAFSIHDSKQTPVVTQGYIKDDRGSVVSNFNSNNSGFGKFDFTPSSFRKYSAYINFNGKEISYPLPPFNFHAGQIALTNQSNGNVNLRVLLEDSAFSKNVASYVIGVSKDSLCFAAIGHGLYMMDVPENKFPEGIATFYLFDQHMKYLSERSVFIKRNDLQVKTSLDKNNYHKREKVTLNISITNSSERLIPSLFSVSVIDTAFANISADCMALKNNYENITLANEECYGDNTPDLMMLLRKNTYNEITSSIKDKKFINDEESFLYIKGKAMDEKNEPADNKILTLFSNSGKNVFITDTTNNKGHFIFPVSNYIDSTQFAIEARNLNNKSAKVKIIKDPILFPHFITPVTLKYYFQKEPVLSNHFKNLYLDSALSNEKMLSPVSLIGKKEPNYNQLKRVSSSSSIITSDQLDERQSVGTAVQKIGGVHIISGFLIINGLTQMAGPNRGSEPLLLIDGVEATNAGSINESPVLSTLNSINPKEIDFIEILKGPEGSNYGLRGGNGVILVNMSSKPTENYKTSGNNNMETFFAKGISRALMFPVMNYDNKQIKASENLDNRSTIFWDGSVLTGDKETVITFFTSDIPTTYKITINGITVHGDIIYKTLYFQSK